MIINYFEVWLLLTNITIFIIILFIIFLLCVVVFLKLLYCLQKNIRVHWIHLVINILSHHVFSFQNHKFWE